ncbi:hypothetical protein BN7_4082 [Wickerhamomyces ciferrii]|uniref:Uncharacterized protein n=1 Tax=Wickerhamomyces ciferrii (strain ATCC 14091 / BCRC 22168 / CBS 111 / JCM 3599 / NBRC 0793 / NRRL Y-1031 F-60-10) TaxID=1206466 RepID=K0KQW5_WICCF|nr:uncharacterized protein BN7_4082 [Wickerhamomyces ciferrii]CCH44517.1 hypothetical protein BN7_4082 [Wickerhamomyces ciferrii]
MTGGDSHLIKSEHNRNRFWSYRMPNYTLSTGSKYRDRSLSVSSKQLKRIKREVKQLQIEGKQLPTNVLPAKFPDFITFSDENLSNNDLKIPTKRLEVYNKSLSMIIFVILNIHVDGFESNVGRLVTKDRPVSFQLNLPSKENLDEMVKRTQIITERYIHDMLFQDLAEFQKHNELNEYIHIFISKLYQNNVFSLKDDLIKQETPSPSDDNMAKDSESEERGEKEGDDNESLIVKSRGGKECDDNDESSSNIDNLKYKGGNSPSNNADSKSLFRPISRTGESKSSLGSSVEFSSKKSKDRTWAKFKNSSATTKGITKSLWRSLRWQRSPLKREENVQETDDLFTQYYKSNDKTEENSAAISLAGTEILTIGSWAQPLTSLISKQSVRSINEESVPAEIIINKTNVPTDSEINDNQKTTSQRSRRDSISNTIKDKSKSLKAKASNPFKSFSKNK